MGLLSHLLLWPQLPDQFVCALQLVELLVSPRVLLGRGGWLTSLTTHARIKSRLTALLSNEQKGCKEHRDFSPEITWLICSWRNALLCSINFILCSMICTRFAGSCWLVSGTGRGQENYCLNEILKMNRKREKFLLLAAQMTQKNWKNTQIRGGSTIVHKTWAEGIDGGRRDARGAHPRLSRGGEWKGTAMSLEEVRRRHVGSGGPAGAPRRRRRRIAVGAAASRWLGT
jgi:hypothetical protein